MAIRAYVLIQTEVGQAAAVTKAVRDIPGIETSEYVAGPYDVIARAATDSVEELGRVVVTRIQQIDGIARTLTCPIVSDE